MTFRDFVAGELIDLIEWMDDSGDTMVARFQRPDNEIKNGAQLIVRPGQVAVFVNQGKIADVFQPGRHTLATANLPLLSKLMGWKYGFVSPFKAEIIFVNTKQFINKKWGTSNPVIVRDAELGMVRLRAFGTFAVKVQDATALVKELVGTNSVFKVEEIEEQLRNLVVTFVSEALGENTSVIDLAKHYPEVGDKAMGRATERMTQYGLVLTQLAVENVSLPPEVEKAVDTRSRMEAVGGIDAYAKIQGADALRDAAKNPSGIASAGVGIGLGAAMAARAMNLVPPTPPPIPGTAGTDEPPPLPDLWFYVVGDKRMGPVDVGSLKQHAGAGTVMPETLVWKKGMAEWTSLSKVPDLLKRVLG